MSRSITVSVDIPAPVEDVWDRLAEVERHADWMSDASTIEFIGDRRTGPGTTIRVRTAVGPLRADDVMRFTGWDPPRSMAVSHIGRIGGTGEFRLEPVRDGTRMTWEEALSFPWYLGGPMVHLVARPVLRRIFQANLDRFRASFA